MNAERVKQLIAECSAELNTYGQKLVDQGLSPGTSGNISIRVDDKIFISATGSELNNLGETDVSVLDLQGELVAGPKPSKEFPLHIAMYGKNPAFEAVVHVHSPYAVAYSCLEHENLFNVLPPITPYLAMRVGQVPMIPYAAPGSDRLAISLQEIEMPFKGVLLGNHGSIAAGKNLADAYSSVIEIEEAARTALLLNEMNVRRLSAADVKELVGQYGTHFEDYDS